MAKVGNYCGPRGGELTWSLTGHDNIQSTTIYLHLDLTRRRHIQKRFITYMGSVLTTDPKIEELLQWEDDVDIMTWLDTL